MRKLVERLDRIASDLESKGLLREAADLDALSNTIEAAHRVEKEVPLSDQQKEALKRNWSEYLKDFRMSAKDVELFSYNDGSFSVIFMGDSDFVAAREAAKYAGPGVDIDFTIGGLSINKLKADELGIDVAAQGPPATQPETTGRFETVSINLSKPEQTC